MPKKAETHSDNSILEKIVRVEHRLHVTKGDLEGLFENYLSDLILIITLRDKLAEEMVDDALPQSADNITPFVGENFCVE